MTTPGYLARPSGEGSWPGVVIVHEIFGLDDDVRRLAYEAAGRGFIALAPDFYDGGRWWRCMRGAFAQLQAGRGSFFETIDSAGEWLAGHEDCTGEIGLIGFCLGGGFALIAGVKPRFSAAAVNYGPLPEDPTILRGACPVVASYGGRDRTLRGSAETLRLALAAARIAHDVETYPSAGHGFMNRWPRAMNALGQVAGMHPGFVPGAQAHAWDRIETFLHRHLDIERNP